MNARDLLLGDADPVQRAHRLLRSGKSREAANLIEQCLPTLGPYERAHAMVLRVGAMFNLGTPSTMVSSVDDAFDTIRDRPEPYLHGHLNALAALAAHRAGALDRVVGHLVNAARKLNQIEVDDEDSACGWHDLAMAYSYTGFHGYAASALRKATEVGRLAGVPEEALTTPSIRLRGALWHDHHGDTESCVLVLLDVVAELAEHRRSGALERLRPSARAAYGYTITRLLALGGSSEPDPRPLFVGVGDGARVRDLVVLGDVCLAMADGRPAEALARLKLASVAPEALGPGEVPRLTALASARAGDYRAAYEADRQAFRVSSAQEEKLREVFVEGVAARLEHEDMRRQMVRYQDAARTDPLTQLPNRRHLEEYVESMVERGEQAVVGVCDMDGFKAVNTIHGHLVGDMVLQRVGEIILKVLRRGDFLARYGGDEFVVVLPRTALAEAHDVASRIVFAVRNHDWTSLAPGTPVSVSIGWAEVSGPRLELRHALVEAFAAADRAMLEAKTHSRARADPLSGPRQLSA